MIVSQHWSGKLFQSVGAAIEKALSLWVELQDVGMSRSDSDDHQRYQAEGYGSRSYAGTIQTIYSVAGE